MAPSALDAATSNAAATSEPSVTGDLPRPAGIMSTAPAAGTAAAHSAAYVAGSRPMTTLAPSSSSRATRVTRPPAANAARDAGTCRSLVSISR